jgi:hypothetical protein
VRAAEQGKAKAGNTSQVCATTYNVVTAILGAVRALPDKSNIVLVQSQHQPWVDIMQAMLCGLLGSSRASMRRAAGQALGTLGRKMGAEFSRSVVVRLDGKLRSKDKVRKLRCSSVDTTSYRHTLVTLLNTPSHS